MNLRKLKIGTRLGVGFALILLGIVVVMLFVNAMNSANRKDVEENLSLASRKQALANSMKSSLYEAGIAMRNIGIQSDVAEMQKEEAKVRAQRKAYDDAKDKISLLGLTDEEKSILNDVAKLDKESEQPFKNAVGQALAFNGEGAVKIITSLNCRMRNQKAYLNHPPKPVQSLLIACILFCSARLVSVLFSRGY